MLGHGLVPKEKITRDIKLSSLTRKYNPSFHHVISRSRSARGGPKRVIPLDCETTKQNAEGCMETGNILVIWRD